MASPNVILLEGDKAVQHEGVVTDSGGIQPGKLVELTSVAEDGNEASLAAASGSAGDTKVPMFMAEKPLTPFTSEHQANVSQIDGTWAQDDVGQVFVPTPGSVVYAWLGQADTSGDGEGTVAAGDLVELDGDNTGNLINSASITGALGVAAEAAVNTSTSDPKRFKVMVI